MIKILNILIALIWSINGFYCKVLNQVPRHEQIVSKIIGTDYSKELTITIGLLEILMALWILSKIQPKLNAIIQIVIILTMNIIEFVIVPDLLLWGKFNILFAFILVLFIYTINFYSNKPKNNRYVINS